MLINIDHGALPGGMAGIEATANINDWSFGVLGSVVYAGLTVGSAAATAILAHGPAVKPALAITLLLNAGCLAAFSLSATFAVLAFLRGLIGMFQVFCTIYMPVWADAFGKGEAQKSVWLTGGLLASPLGVVLGYGLTYVISKNTKTLGADGKPGGPHPAGEWEWSFRIQAACLIPVVISIMVIPSKYFNIEESSQFRTECVTRASNRVSANKRAK